MKTAAQWKRFYADERAQLGEAGLDAKLDLAPRTPFPQGGALLFPHTRLAVTGDLTAAVAQSVVDVGAHEVLALGVLHGGREADADAVKLARGGDAGAIAAMRRVHDRTARLCAEEFSLDNFEVMLARAAARAGRKAPTVHVRYPFLVGADPTSVPGVDDVARLAERMPVVATTDPIHHGPGYGTPPAEQRAAEEGATTAWAREGIAAQLEALLAGRWNDFERRADALRSDFRDVGPVLGQLLQGRPRTGAILELRLVDYAAVLGAPAPTWVAGPLLRAA